MKKRMMAVYALIGALAVSPALTSCVDDDSTTIEAHRNSEVEQLKALASLQTLQAETEKILAESEAAKAEAEAVLKKASASNIKEEVDLAKELFVKQMKIWELDLEQKMINLEVKRQNLYQELSKERFDDGSDYVEAYLDSLKSYDYTKNRLYDKKTSLMYLKNDLISEEEFRKKAIDEITREIAKNEAFLKKLNDLKQYDGQELVDAINKFLTQDIKSSQELALLEQKSLNMYFDLINYSSVPVTDFEEYETSFLPRFTFMPEQLEKINKTDSSKLFSLNKQFLNLHIEGLSELIYSPFMASKERVFMDLNVSWVPDTETSYPLFTYTYEPFTNLFEELTYESNPQINEVAFLDINEDAEKAINVLKEEIGEPSNKEEEKPATGMYQELEEAKQQKEEIDKEEDAPESAKEAASINVNLIQKAIDSYINHIKKIEKLCAELEKAKQILQIDSPEYKEYMAAVEVGNNKGLELEKARRQYDELEAKTFDPFQRNYFEELCDNSIELNDAIFSAEFRLLSLQNDLEKVKNDHSLEEHIEWLEKEIAHLENLLKLQEESIAKYESLINECFASSEK